MEEFYKITKEQADFIGKFEYQEGYKFDPYASEQKDGTFLVTKEMYQLIKTILDKKVDFKNIPVIEKSSIDRKESKLVSFASIIKEENKDEKLP